jgi:hypothetical protein
MSDLDTRLLQAHAADDKPTLVALYEEAADSAGTDLEAACFYLTHAYVFALELGHPHAPQLHQKLCAQGRES